jgi:ABC-type multidrug transport system fused ATPase/permease subunit
LVIAHRLSTIRQADLILVMNAGRVIEVGTFDALYAQGGRFTDIVKQQFNASVEHTPQPIK